MAPRNVIVGMSRTSPKSLRAAKGASDDESEVTHGSLQRSQSPENFSDTKDVGGHSDDATDDEDESYTRDSDKYNNAQENLRNISFGALAEAQEDLSQSQLRNSQSNLNHERYQEPDAEKINNLRARLSELRKLRSQADQKAYESEELKKSTSREKEAAVRASKHAPAEQSSRWAVTRKRPILDVAQDPYHSRDPRFSSTTTSSSSHRPDSEVMKKKYAFLKSYRDAELAELKDNVITIKARKRKRKSKALMPDEETELQELERQINSIENKLKSDQEREHLKDVARRHKKEEREKIKQGKNPFYLKRSEVKQRALRERFEGMKAREKDRAIERRRKKLSHRERKAMPVQRRNFE